MDAGRLTHVRNWSREEVQPRIRRPRNLFYFFGGPDFLWAVNMFPGAETYILAGLEPVGEIPELSRIPAPVLEESLDAFRYSMRSILEKGFYETREMREDLKRGSIRGVLPALVFFTARTGHRVVNVEHVSLDASGTPQSAAPGSGNGVRITFQPENGAGTQTLYYFHTDLSDEGIKKNTGFMNFVESRGRGISYLKAASYLMHGGGFNRAKNFLLSRSDAILQDDSGIPFRDFDPNAWQINLYGMYHRPVDIFAEKFQPDLRAAYESTGHRPLPFGTGYRRSDAGSNQLLAIRRSTAQ
jgi:hypothetical protein